MSKKTILRALLAITLMFLAGLGMIRFKASSTASQQQGYRGTGMAQLDDGDVVQARLAAGGEPLIHKPARVRQNGPIAGTTYKNVQVLTELPIGEFGRTMTAMTDWVAGKESCNYCHVDGNFASDEKYTKVVARRMLQMVRHVNNTWKPHVGETGITCYTCHRGNALPSERWFTPAPDQVKGAFTGHQARNTPSMTVRLAALPNDPYTAFLKGPETVDEIRVAASAALADRAYGEGQKAVNAEKTYGLMLHVTQALGVNCTFCHNSRAFASWAESSPQRVTAWKGIRMVRDLNNQFMEPLSPTFPANPEGRLGPTGDAAKVNCATCHQGVNKPLKGFQMAKHYPGLTLPYVMAAAPAASAASAAETPEAPASAASAATPPESAASAMELLAAAKPASSAAPARAVVLAAAAPPAPPPSTTVAVAVAPPTPVAAAAPPAPANPFAALAASGADPCPSLVAAALKGVQAPPGGPGRRVVTGSGRLQFYAAPDLGCRQKGVFILAGEAVEAIEQFGGFTTVHYVNPRTGNHAQGWVATARLAAAGPSADRSDQEIVSQVGARP
jgi:photosynthetic reaction center cytochrome c subunit